MKIKFLPYQPHCFAYGGFEVQTLSTLQAVQKAGVNATKLDVWDRDSSYDVLNCWGLGIANYENVYWAKKSGKKIVISALFPYYETLFEKTKYVISAAIYKVKLMREMAKMADHIIVVNDIQANICHKYFSVPFSKISIIPNVVKREFFIGSKTPSSLNHFSTKFNTSDFILSTGNVCRRKNQLNLAKACLAIESKLVLIGKVLDGEDEYGKELDAIVKANESITWIPGLEAGSPDLVNAYNECTAFALPSYEEQQPISLLEAAALQKPLVIADRAYAYQKYYTNALKVNPSSVNNIAEGIQKIRENGANFIAPYEFVRECTEENVGSAYLDVYKQLI